MNSYLLQALNATRKTYKNKRSNIFIFIFISIVSFLGKCLIITKPMFKMYDLNIAKTTALYNEIDFAEGFKGADNLNANVKVWLLSLVKVLFIIALILCIGLICGGLFLVGLGIDEISSVSNLFPNLIVPVAIVSVIVFISTVAMFVPSTYVSLAAADKSLFNILYCCKRSLSIKLLVRYVIYNLLYLLTIIAVPTAMLFLYIAFKNVEIVATILNIVCFILFIIVFSYAKLTKDTAIYLLFRNTINLKPSQLTQRDLTEEEKLTEIFN